MLNDNITYNVRVVVANDAIAFLFENGNSVRWDGTRWRVRLSDGNLLLRTGHLDKALVSAAHGEESMPPRRVYKIQRLRETVWEDVSERNQYGSAAKVLAQYKCDEPDNDFRVHVEAKEIALKQMAQLEAS